VPPRRNIDAILIPDRLKDFERASTEKKEFLLKEFGGNGLRHDGMPEVAVTTATMGHFITSGISGEKVSLICDRHALNALFMAGHVLQEPVVFIDKKALREGHYKIDNSKLNWAECWHVIGKARVNGRRIVYDFTVVKRIDDGKFEAYDLKIDRQ